MRQNLEEKYRDISTFKVGEVARKAGVNKETLRYYEKRKLITKPDRRRSGPCDCRRHRRTDRDDI